MTPGRALVPLIAAVLLAAACGRSEVEELAGTYEVDRVATTGRLTQAQRQAIDPDRLASLVLRLHLSADGTFTSSARAGDAPGGDARGTWTLARGVVTLTTTEVGGRKAAAPDVVRASVQEGALWFEPQDDSQPPLVLVRR